MIRRAEVGDERLEAITRVVVAEWAPRRVILFGSRARGDHRPDSDYDLMIVIDAPGSVDDCEIAIRTRVSSAGHPVDVSVATTEAFERRRTDVGTLEYAADREGLVLYGSGGSDAPRLVRERLAVPASFGEWLKRAESDYLAMLTLRGLAAASITDATAFHAHQCAEKYLKAALILVDVQPPRTHVLKDLLVIGDSRLQHDPGLVKACATLDDLWPKTRYPKEKQPSVEEAERAVEAAEVVRSAVRAIAGPAIRSA